MELLWRIISGTVALICILFLVFYSVWRGVKSSGDPVRLVFKIVISICIVIFSISLMHKHPSDPGEMFYNLAVALVFCVPTGLLWVSPAIEWLAKPLTNIFDGGDEEAEPEPLYSMAESKRKNCRYEEAIRDIQVQLEKFPDDFMGTMMLASIQAEDLNDLPTATDTLENLLAKGKLPAHSTVAALQMLADWHLKYRQDAAAARGFLQRIIDKYPDTPLEHNARQRLARMESAEAVFEEREKGGVYEVKQGLRNIGLRREATVEEVEPDPSILANQYVKQLERHPMDTDTREKLALLYAEKFQRLELALDQLEQLIAHPSETPAHIGRWLNLVATLRIQQGKDMDGAVAALHRLIERFPKSAVAYAATTRLAHLDQELKGLEKGEVKTLGVYEQKLGLKKAASPVSG